MTKSSAEIQQEINKVNNQRARLTTEQPPGWHGEYAELQRQVTELSEQWMAAREREEMV